MALTQFQLFRFLPLELRREIYLLATPPRVVHVQEEVEEDYDDFCERLHTTVNPIRLGSSLKHFAFNWRPHVPRKGKQPPLESFGFTGARPPTQPWEPSPSTPEIPLDWLGEHPDIAWEFARRNHFYSSAPIPALLHACTDSRLALMSMGYRLAFRTRWRGPRTWYNFGRDTLYLEFCSSWESSYKVLSGGIPWDLGQFDLEEMRQVRKLALWNAAAYISQFNFAPGVPYGPIPELSFVLRLFSGLEELQLVEWSAGCLTETLTTDGLEVADRIGPEPRQQHKYDIQRLWTCIDVSEVDALLRLFCPKLLWERDMYSVGANGGQLRAYKEKHGNESCYFETTQAGFQTVLTKDMARLISAEKIDTIIPWKIPRFRTVHILSPREHRMISQERLNISRDIYNLQQEWAFISQSKAESTSSPRDWDEVEQAFGEKHWPDNDYWVYTQDLGGFPSARMQKKWWIQHGPAPKVGHLLL
ncbi:hypothetical protein ACHAPT_011153 [Fusarium lateritium]